MVGVGVSAGQLAELHEHADQRVDLEGAAGLGVLQHGRLVLPDLLGAGDALLHGEANPHVEPPGDLEGFGHHGRGQLSGVLVAADLRESGAGEGADGIEGQVAPGLHPEVRANVGQHSGGESGVAECRRHGAGAVGLRAVELTHRETVALDVGDDPRGHLLGGWIGDAADDARRRHRRGQHAIGIEGPQAPPVVLAAVALEVPPTDPVLHRHNHSVGSVQVPQFVSDRGDLVRFQGQDHNVMRDRFRCEFVRRDNVRHQFASVGFPQSQAVPLSDGVEVLAAGDDADRPAGRSQPYRHQAADRPGTHNADPHRRILPRKRRNPPGECTRGGFMRGSGGDLLSQDVSVQVPSALVGLTTVFGMGTGVAPPL